MIDKNVPIQLFCVFSTLGKPTPVRFRFENADHKIQTIDISEILSEKEIHYNGREAILYTCKAQIDSVEKLFEIKYAVTPHKWIFNRMLT